MFIILLALIIGICVGFVLPITFNTNYTIYVAMVILSSFDSIFGAINSYLKNTYDTKILLSGLLGNTIITLFLVYFGEKVGVPMYYAAIVVFGGRIFNNFAKIRRKLLKK